MRILLLALVALMALGGTQAMAQCDPTKATAGMLGCLPAAPSAAGSDYLQLWQPSLFPNALHKITVDSLFAGRGTWDAKSPGPIGTTTPSTGAFTGLVVGSPSGGDMGPGTINTQQIFVNGVLAGPADPGSYANGSVALSTAPLQIFAANTDRVRIKIINYSGFGTTGGTPIAVWCRWGTVASAPASAGGLGSFGISSGGGGIDDQGNGVNQGPINCLSESGTPNVYAEQY